MNTDATILNIDFLKASFTTTCLRLGQPFEPSFFQLLLNQYQEPHRYYHHLEHVQELLELHTSHIEKTSFSQRDRSMMELALWGHDAIYHPQRSDNEHHSAQWMQDKIPSSWITEAEQDWLNHAILATQKHTTQTDPKIQWVLDLDLSILASSPGRFQRYHKQIRLEYAFVPTPVFELKRHAILQEFSKRNPLYQHPLWHELLEPQARENLRPWMNVTLLLKGTHPKKPIKP